jgi:hypothetical protein
MALALKLITFATSFLLTSLLLSGLNIALEIYFMGRTFFLLVPQFLTFRHKVRLPPVFEKAVY